MIRLILIFIFSTSAFGQDLNFDSPRCQELAAEKALPDWECRNEFTLDSSSALNEINTTSDNIADHLVEVGTINNLSNLIKQKLMQSHFESFKQKLILAKGLGGDLKGFINEVEAIDCLTDSTRKKYLDLINGLNQVPSKNLEKEKQAFYRKMQSVFVETVRLKLVIEKYQDTDDPRLEAARTALRQINTQYPMIIHSNATAVGNNAWLLVSRLAKGKATQEELKAQANNTDSNINALLDLPQSLATNFNSQRDENNIFTSMHTQIHGEGYKDSFFEKQIPNLALKSVSSSVTGLKKLCEANACETFKIIPHEIAAITDEISDNDTRDRVDKYICNCKIRYQDDTLPLSLHLGIVAGTIGFAVGCVAFPPLCVATAAMGLIGMGTGVKDFITVRGNANLIKEETYAQVAIRGYHENFVQDHQRFRESQNDYALQAALVPLEFLGATADFAVVYKAASKTTSTLTPLRAVAEDAEELIEKASAFTHIKSRSALVDQFEEYDPATDEMRKAWIASARANSAKAYVDIENGMLKRLNDLGDKEAVTALTNIHKKVIIEGIEKLKLKYPNLDIKVYSDFKSIRLALDGEIPPAIQEELKTIFVNAGDEVSGLVNRLRESGELKIPAYEHSETWFAGGYGKSADEAGLAAREARCRHDKPCSSPILDFSDPQNLQNLVEAREEIEDIRVIVTSALKQLKSDVPMYNRVDGIDIPSPELIEVIRKNLDKDPEVLNSLIHDKFNVKMDQNITYDIIDYVNGLKRFEPGIWVESRQLASLDEAAHGGFSADFTGMGSYNIEQVAKDLAAPHRTMESLLGGLRAGEQKVTESFNTKKKFFETITTKAYADNDIPIKVVCSGDDCVAYPIKETGLTPAQQRDIQDSLIKSINASDSPSGFRLAFVPPRAAKEVRSRLATHGELIEKQVRKLAFRSQAIPFKESQNITIAIRMPSSLGKGRVEVVVAGAKNLTAKQKEELQKYVESAIKASNEVKDGPNSNYRLRGVRYL